MAKAIYTSINRGRPAAPTKTVKGKPAPQNKTTKGTICKGTNSNKGPAKAVYTKCSKGGK